MWWAVPTLREGRLFFAHRHGVRAGPDLRDGAAPGSNRKLNHNTKGRYLFRNACSKSRSAFLLTILSISVIR